MNITQKIYFRIVVFVVAISLLCLLLLAYLIFPRVEDNIRELVSKQQLALANSIANDIEKDLYNKSLFIENLSDQLQRNMTGNDSNMESYLSSINQITPIFNAGLHLISFTDEKLIATTSNKTFDDIPEDIISKLTADSDSDDHSIISAPLKGQITGKSFILLVSKFITQESKTLLITGMSYIGEENFLSSITKLKIGETGDGLLISVDDEIFVASSKPEMILRPTPAQGINKLHDKAMSGYRGTGITINAFGIEELSAIASVPTPNWFVVTRLPTQEAFKPYSLLVSVLTEYSLYILIFLASLLLVFLHILIKPLITSSAMIKSMSKTGDLQKLPIFRHDEIGELSQGFNNLVDKLKEKEIELNQALGEISEQKNNLHHLAHHDVLTGLPNRLLFTDRLEQAVAHAVRDKSGLAVLFCDLDDFKSINDGYGHDAGDTVLREITNRLTQQRRKTDTIARMGGDEFVILLTDLKEAKQEAVAIGNAYISAVAKPITINGQEFNLSVSIGVAIFSEASQSNYTWLLKNADRALYQAKKAGKNCLAVSDI